MAALQCAGSDHQHTGGSCTTAASDFAAQAKLSREQIRSQNKADLQAIINNRIWEMTRSRRL
ncbi:MAG: SpoIIIAH-like family protein [Blautia marasmi]